MFAISYLLCVEPRSNPSAMLFEIETPDQVHSLSVPNFRCTITGALSILTKRPPHMKYTRFEELPVWQAAIELAVRVFALTSHIAFKGHYDLKDQLERSGVSISNNIAEGFERGSTQETLTFLYISRGSSGELRSMTCLLERLPRFQDLRFEISDLRSRAESISRQLRAWCDSLQNTDIRGQRYLTEKSRRIAKQAREREEFLKELEHIRNQKH
jgi:four helix bundle protein